MSEMRDLIRNPPEGIEYVENEENSVSEIHAVIMGPEETPFYGGRFRMKLVISEEYPNVPPRGYFLTKMFHPNIASNGDICVNTLKKDWNPQVTIKHVLQVIRCLLIIPFPESSLNDEAGKLFMESYEEYAVRARIMTEVHAMSSSDGKTGKLASGDVDVAGGANSHSSLRPDEGSHKTEEVNAISQKKKKEQEVKKKNMKRL
jgi:ubiquitin-conjugating enzyme E2 S